MTPEERKAIQSGKMPATNVRLLVDAVRQNLAGAGADMLTIRLLLGLEESADRLPLSTTLRVIAAVLPEHGSAHAQAVEMAEQVTGIEQALERLTKHVSAMNEKCTLAMDAHFPIWELRLAVDVIEGLAEQQAMDDEWYREPLAQIKAALDRS